MKGNDILQAMDSIDEAIVAECMEAKRPGLRWLPALAACLAVILLVGILLPRSPVQLSQPSQSTQPIPSTQPTQPGPVVTPLQMAFRWEGAMPQANSQNMVIAPQYYFHRYPVVVARAVEVLPDTYEELPTCSTSEIKRWRIFRMEVLDPLDSGLTGEFWFGLPEEAYQDLTAWDTLLLSLRVRYLDLSLRNTGSNSLETFEAFCRDPNPDHGDIVAFKDGVFDDQLWRHTLWADPPFFPTSAYWELLRGNNSLIVGFGSTLEDALAVIEERRAQSGDTPTDLTVPDAVLTAMESLDDSFLGTGVQYKLENKVSVPYIYYTRYIGGCATNEYALIHPKTGEIHYSDTRFTDADLENLPDLAAFVQALDWDDLELTPFEKRGERLYRSAFGWYQKTEDGVLAFVKVTWYHASTEGGKMSVVYDDLFLQVTADGTEVMTRQQMLGILGMGHALMPPYFHTEEGPIHLRWMY